MIGDLILIAFALCEDQLPGKRGYSLLYRAHVTQAERGCDFDFLEGDDTLPEPDIY
jgi:hypothetical protein